MTTIEVIESKLPLNIFDKSDALQISSINGIIKDVFIEMETCFKNRFYFDLDGIKQEDWNRVGVETNYNPIQISIVGDFSAWRFLVRKMLEQAQILGLSISQGGGKFIKKAKAGSVETEFSERDLKNNPLIVSIDSLISQLKSDVMRKARNLGCIIDINEDNIYKIELESGNISEFPMFILTEKRCNCND